MSNGSSNQVISLPKGGGTLKGIGEAFSPDPHTGTGNFTVPIALPPGRNGFQPELSLVYSTGNGIGPFGLGWNLGVHRDVESNSELLDVLEEVASGQTAVEGLTHEEAEKLRSNLLLSQVAEDATAREKIQEDNVLTLEDCKRTTICVVVILESSIEGGK